jgi:hypothetical protein
MSRPDFTASDDVLLQLSVFASDQDLVESNAL